MVVEYIDAHRDRIVEGRPLGVEPICEVLTESGVRIAPSTYYATRTRRPSARAVRDAELRGQIATIHRENLGVYGARKVHAELCRRGGKVARCTVERLMRAEGLRGIAREKTRKTTLTDGAETPRPLDRVQRQFVATSPNQLWVADLTYVRTHAGWVYVAFIVDVYSQRIVAWHAQTTKHVELVMIPLRMALWERGRQGHPIQTDQLRAHSDAGSQYVSLAYTDKLALDGIAPSIGSVGDALDNALMETINGLYKTECIRTTVFHNGPYKTIADVEFATAGWVDWYNTRRLHSSLGYVPPAEFEQAHYATSTESRNPYRSGREPGALQCYLIGSKGFSPLCTCSVLSSIARRIRRTIDGASGNMLNDAPLAFMAK